MTFRQLKLYLPLRSFDRRIFKKGLTEVNPLPVYTMTYARELNLPRSIVLLELNTVLILPT